MDAFLFEVRHLFSGQPCALFCKPKDPQSRFSAKLASKVLDGTPCRPGSIDICIDGKCQVEYNNEFTQVRNVMLLIGAANTKICHGFACLQTNPS